MPSHKETQILPYNCRQMFDLVAAVDQYPEFLPWCRAARILEREEGRMRAELIIVFKHLTERYTSEVTLNAPQDAGSPGSIQVHMTEGPFHHLENNWEFKPLDDGGTQIEFFIDFQFRSKLLDALIGKLFSRAAEKMVSAFRQRADMLYKSQS